VIETLTREDLVKDLGKTGLETISIILYKGPISRAEIDYIRGARSNFILRNLLMRGLIEKVAKLDDNRAFLYKPSFELLSYLGLSKIEDAPEYAEVKKEFEAAKEEISKNEETAENSLDDGVQNIENTDNGNRNESSDTRN
ncbi:MAG: SMC-Scp complex subunit ScpB, partial [Patescibacteria group bacterium]|nr:SMC-Scp complex subunit ScpB [Patescibacteria group bacterium]